jgi:hypothetical protein
LETTCDSERGGEEGRVREFMSLHFKNRFTGQEGGGSTYSEGPFSSIPPTSKATPNGRLCREEEVDGGIRKKTCQLEEWLRSEKNNTYHDLLTTLSIFTETKSSVTNGLCSSFDSHWFVKSKSVVLGVDSSIFDHHLSISSQTRHGSTNV